MQREDQTSRLFVAIELPDDVLEVMAHCQKEIRKSQLVEGTYVKPENSHLTLKFLGDVSHDKIPQVIEALQSCRCDALKLQLKDIGTFPERGRTPRVIWIGVQSAPLVNLVSQIGEALSFISVPSENRFKAHLTLMRVKECIDQKKLLELLRQISFEETQFVVSRFVLFESKLTPSGPKHRPLAGFRLGH